MTLFGEDDPSPVAFVAGETAQLEAATLLARIYLDDGRWLAALPWILRTVDVAFANKHTRYVYGRPPWGAPHSLTPLRTRTSFFLEATLLLARALLALPGAHREAHELATAVLPQAQASGMPWARADALLVAALALALDTAAPNHQRDAARLATEAEQRT